MSIPALASSTPSAPAPAAPPDPPGRDGRIVHQPPAPNPRSLAATIARRPVYAVIVGINPAPLLDLAQLGGAVNDANDMAAALTTLGADPANILVLRDGQATADAILSALDWLVATAGPDATAVVYFAGHVLKVGQSTEAIVSVDGGLITDNELAGRVAGLRSRDAWFVFATCFGGGFTELLGPGRALTAASDADSFSYESAVLGRSYLGEYLIRRGLLQARAGSPTVDQAVAYAQATLANERPDRQIVHFDEAPEPISLDGLIRLAGAA